MRIAVGLAKDDVEQRLRTHGISRRQFLAYCTAVAAAMGLGPAFAPEVARALTGGSGRRTCVVYLHNAECTGCTEALLRTSAPYLDALLFDAISLEYQESIMAAAGEAAEEALHNAIHNPEGFLCIVEGGIPTAGNGLYGKIANKTMLSINEEVLPRARAVIAYGTCASYGGIQAAAPNPTGSKGVGEVLGDRIGGKLINLPGCPPNPINIVGVIAHYLKEGTIPSLDALGRPDMFFSKSVHEQCERRPHFDAGRFANSFASDEARQGWCLYNLGCKGPQTYNNCPSAKFNGTNWPVAAGHPCIGCSEPDFWDHMSPFYPH